jgi:hypothetical protein
MQLYMDSLSRQRLSVKPIDFPSNPDDAAAFDTLVLDESEAQVAQFLTENDTFFVNMRNVCSSPLLSRHQSLHPPTVFTTQLEFDNAEYLGIPFMLVLSRYHVGWYLSSPLNAGLAPHTIAQQLPGQINHNHIVQGNPDAQLTVIRNDDLSGGAIGGIVAAVFALVLLAILVATIVRRKLKRQILLVEEYKEKAASEELQVQM